MPAAAPAVVRVARRPAAVLPVLPADQEVSMQPHESAGNIVWGTLAEGELTVWTPRLADGQPDWAPSVISPTV
jgi:hypothetical protein